MATVFTQDQVVDVVVELLVEKNRDTDGVTVDSAFADIGLDSVDYAELFMALEDSAGARLDPDSASRLIRVGDLMSLRPL
ncbi:phosphopantetheine-binding protein [Williamsia sterculiae]|uniref:Acyl carrier protein n=1 Tax=Williamsia sterculiae TaxID=1344003 RepID=A0A1N7DPA1_9NOCA|nr:phosphopantetheine-binding protein [Williamsia sterculiae]SIR77702.1 acyl carrier protein [Williamsia sterculiae]